MEISVYGAAGCPQMALVTEFISAGGAKVRQVDIESNPISPVLMGRLLAFEDSFKLSHRIEQPSSSPAGNGMEEVDAQAAKDSLENLRDKPVALSVPLAVRGSRVIVASSPARVQSLMY